MADGRGHEDPIGNGDGRLIRPYSLTGGRTRPSRTDLAMTSQVIAVPSVDTRTDVEPEAQEILAHCSSPLAVAELASRTGLPLGVLRILLSDLMDQGHVMVYTSRWKRGRPHPDVLRSVIDRIRAL